MHPVCNSHVSSGSRCCVACLLAGAHRCHTVVNLMHTAVIPSCGFPGQQIAALTYDDSQCANSALALSTSLAFLSDTSCAPVTLTSFKEQLHPVDSVCQSGLTDLATVRSSLPVGDSSTARGEVAELWHCAVQASEAVARSKRRKQPPS